MGKKKLAESNSNKLEHLSIMCLPFLIMFFGFTTFVWLYNDSTPLIWDSGDYLTKSVMYFNILQRESIGGIIYHLPFVDNYRPPLTSFIAGMSYFVFGINIDLAVLTCYILAFSLCIIATYLLLSLLINKKVAILTCCLFPLFPEFFRWNSLLMSDMWAAGWITLTYYFIVLYYKKETRNAIIGAGICLGIAQLFRAMSFVYLIGGVIFFLVKKKNMRFVLWISCISLMIMFPWYGFHSHELVEKYVFEVTEKGYLENDPTFFSIDAILYYPQVAIRESFGITLSLLIALILLGNIRSILKSRILWWWLSISFLILILIQNKNPRYLIPLLIPLASLLAIAISSISNGNIRKTVIVLFIGLGILIYLSYSFIGYRDFNFYGENIDWRERGTFTTISPYMYKLDSITRTFLFPLPPKAFNPIPLREDWKVEKIEKVILKDSDSKPRILIATTFPLLASPLIYNQFITGAYHAELAINNPDYINQSDFILIKEGWVVDNWQKKNIDQFYQELPLIEQRFTVVYNDTLPNNEHFIIFKRRGLE